MREAKRVLRWAGVACVGCLGVALSARADDLALIEVGASGKRNYLPPNVLFIFDSSGSMNALICEDQGSSTRECLRSRNVTARVGPHGARVCEDKFLKQALGPDRETEGATTTYVPPFEHNGTSFVSPRYPIFDPRGNPAHDDLFPPGSIWRHDDDDRYRPWERLALGQGSTTRAKIVSAINAQCRTLDSCEARSRCIYSLRTQGYFFESWRCYAEGDPMGICDESEGVSTTSRGPFVLGDLLNFYPPKGIGLIGVFKGVVDNLGGDARLAVSDFSDARRGGRVRFSVHPPCSQVGEDCLDGDPETRCFEKIGHSGNQNLRNYLDNTLRFSGGTPLARVLDNAGAYFARRSGSASAICDPQSVDGLVCGQGNNFVVLITDGFPTGDAEDVGDLPFVGTQVSDLANDSFASNEPGDSFLDEVAYALAQQIDLRPDLDNPSVPPDQDPDDTAITFVVSYGLTNPDDAEECVGLLNQTATAGQGECMTALSAAELQDKLTELLALILERSLGFTAPLVPTTRRSAVEGAYFARFEPHTDFPLWEGHLYGFGICSEALPPREGEEPCECGNAQEVKEICFLDVNDDPVTYDDDGRLVSTPRWDAQMCLSGDPGGGPPDVSLCYRSASARKIETVVERSPPENELTSTDALDFLAANLQEVPQLLAALAVENNLERAEGIVNFYRGYDALDADGDGNTQEDRNLGSIRDNSDNAMPGWWKMGDIFHSRPIEIRPPNGKLLGSWSGTESYERFMSENKDRLTSVVVGTNGAMVHAFLAGGADSEADNGRELWAFVSPELLPELKEICDPVNNECRISKHRWGVDASPMEREIWLGGPETSMEDPENWTFWRNVLVIGHRRGGTTYIALDVTDPEDPSFLWSFPQASQRDNTNRPVADLMGQSWLEVFPAPASIGLLKIDADGDPSTGDTYYKSVTLLSAGYDPLDRRGRALFILDTWTGDILWMAQPSATGDLQRMKYSFPATPSFHTDASESRPTIAGIVAADHGGQLWYVDTRAPALIEDGRISNFEAELFFSSLETPIDPDASGGNNDEILDPDEYQRRPFFFTPTLTWTANRHFRVIIGTGDRDRLLPEDGLHEDIKDAVCGRGSGGGEDDSVIQRLYAIDIGPCRNKQGPCTEEDLAEVTGQQSIDPSKMGWFLRMEPGEKAAATFNIVAGIALYSTFLPGSVCQEAMVCQQDSMAIGQARLWARHFMTGKNEGDWDKNGVVDEDDGEALTTGEGVPTAPTATMAISKGVAVLDVATTASHGSPGVMSVSDTQYDLVQDILVMPVSRRLHEVLHVVE